VSDSSTLLPSTEPHRQSDRPTPIDPARREAKRGKPISNLRHEPVKHFVGRDDLLESLRDALHSGHRAAVKIVNDAVPGELLTHLASWPIIRQLLPHAKESATHALQLGIEPEATGRLLNEVGLYLKIRAEFVEAKCVLERAVRIDEQAFGLDHPTVGIRVNNLGGVLHDLGDLPGARRAFGRALGIFKRFLGDEHPNTKRVRDNLKAVKNLLGCRHESSE